MEDAIKEGYAKRQSVEKPLMVRYADDFLIFHSKREEIEKAATRITEWLATMGLSINTKKTRVTHTLTSHEGKVGFDFLGFTVRQFQVGKTHTGKNTHGKPLGYKTIIKPSKEAIKRHMNETKLRIRKLGSVSQVALIKVLNPAIWGWSAYYKTVVSSKVFSRCDHNLFHQIVRWTRKRHPMKSSAWRKAKYWQTRDEGQQVFSTPEGSKLRMHSETKIQRHEKVKGNASPYDGNTRYWSQRLKKHPMMHETKARLLQVQQGKCRWCELTLKEGDVLEIDHMDHNRKNNALRNKILLHRHCHDERHAMHEEAQAKRQKLRDAGINIK